MTDSHMLRDAAELIASSRLDQPLDQESDRGADHDRDDGSHEPAALAAAPQAELFALRLLALSAKFERRHESCPQCRCQRNHNHSYKQRDEARQLKDVRRSECAGSD
jgi:hypothetical protein